MENIINHIRAISYGFERAYLYITNNNVQQDEEDVDLDPQIKRILKTMLKLTFFILYLVYWIPTRVVLLTLLLLEWIIMTFLINPILLFWFWCMNIQDPLVRVDLRRRIARFIETFSYIAVSVSVLSLIAYLLHPYVTYRPARAKSNILFQGHTKNWTAIVEEYHRAWTKLQNDKENLDIQIKQLQSEFNQHQNMNDADHIKIWNEIQNEQNQIDLILRTLDQEVRNTMDKEDEMDDTNSNTNDISLENLSKLICDILNTQKTEQMIQTAISVYHQDVLNRADYALIRRDARIISRLTSHTYDKYPVWIQSIQGFFAVTPTGNSPSEAISPETNIGECWTMYGTKGTLGIKLSEPIIIESITIDHPSFNIMAGDMTKAPRKIELYGIRHVAGTTQKVYLGEAEYDIHNDYTVQTFDMNVNQKNPFNIAQVHILSNWGNPDCTEVYRVRIHGTPSAPK